MEYDEGGRLTLTYLRSLFSVVLMCPPFSPMSPQLKLLRSYFVPAPLTVARRSMALISPVSANFSQRRYATPFFFLIKNVTFRGMVLPWGHPWVPPSLTFFCRTTNNSGSGTVRLGLCRWCTTGMLTTRLLFLPAGTRPFSSLNTWTPNTPTSILPWRRNLPVSFLF